MTSAQRKAAIVEAAVRLFSERGFRGTTTRDLAKAVGVSEPVLYEHFKSKRDLHQAMIEAKSQEGRERAEALLGPCMEAQNDRAVFQTLGELILRRYAEEPAYFRLLLFLALEGNELAQLFYDRQITRTHHMVAGYLRKRMEQGALRRMDPNLAARSFISMIVNHGMMRMFFQDHLVKGSARRVVAGMVGIYLEGMRRPKRGGQKRGSL
jgi:AcrR family transcriptional regulator